MRSRMDLMGQAALVGSGMRRWGTKLAGKRRRAAFSNASKAGELWGVWQRQLDGNSASYFHGAVRSSSRYGMLAMSEAKPVRHGCGTLASVRWKQGPGQKNRNRKWPRSARLHHSRPGPKRVSLFSRSRLQSVPGPQKGIVSTAGSMIRARYGGRRQGKGEPWSFLAI